MSRREKKCDYDTHHVSPFLGQLTRVPQGGILSACSGVENVTIHRPSRRNDEIDQENIFRLIFSDHPANLHIYLDPFDFEPL